MKTVFSVAVATALMAFMSASAAERPRLHDILIEGGLIYDGSGGAPFAGDVVIDGDRVSYVGPHREIRARRVIDARGAAVAPGFVNMLSHAEESLLVDGRAASDLLQGVTLEVIGEGASMGPLTDTMAALNEKREDDIKYPITWRSLAGYLDKVEKSGISVNLASMVGASTVRADILGEGDVQPTPDQLARMRDLVRAGMEDGALGVSSALIYAPSTYAKTPELKALATEAGRCGGIYTTHMRSEGADILGAIDETIAIARASGAPAEIYHLKIGGRSNWSKYDAVIARIEAARASGVHLTADMYPYTAGATGLDASMPHWVLDGGLEAWIARMKDPAVRARLIAEMRSPPPGFESLLAMSGPGGARLLGFKTDKLKPLTGKTLADVAKLRGESPEDTVIDLVIEDGSRVEVAYTVMSEDNIRREIRLPWVSFDSDEEASAPEGVFLESAQHPRAYGTFARVLGRYVRDEKDVSLQDAVHRLAALPASVLSLDRRGTLRAGYYADVVVFDPATITDHATFEKSQVFASGVRYVLVNGGVAVDDGRITNARPGRVVRGRAWTGAPGGGCRATAKAWSWSQN